MLIIIVILCYTWFFQQYSTKNPWYRVGQKKVYPKLFFYYLTHSYSNCTKIGMDVVQWVMITIWKFCVKASVFGGEMWFFVQHTLFPPWHELFVHQILIWFLACFSKSKHYNLLKCCNDALKTLIKVIVK